MQSKIRFPFSLLICSLMIIATAHTAGMPDWAKNFDPYQKYPAETHLAGLGTSEGSDSEALRIAEDNARAAVSRMIVVEGFKLFPIKPAYRLIVLKRKYILA